MELKRKPFQGVINIIRFNWHFYAIAIIAISLLLVFQNKIPSTIKPLVLSGVIIAAITLLTSILVSYYIYDASDLYELNWLKNFDYKKVLNINAGFDEISEIITTKFPDTNLIIADFYNAEKHTEISIKRARKAYPPNPKTISVQTDKLPFPDNSFEYSVAIFSAHEIRDEKERIIFFKELARVTKREIHVTEHLRDFKNFLAYTIGFLHFHSRKKWIKTFTEADLAIAEELKSTPFVTTFILKKNGTTL